MRSKSLFVANVLSSIWAGWSLFHFGSFLAEGGWDALVTVNDLAKIVRELLGSSDSVATVINVFMVLLMVHIILFSLGSILGWLGYALKRSGCAKFAAVLYLLATILFPIFIFIGLPITIFGFVGQKNQRKLSVPQTSQQ
ncbi:MAG: hypothetical protein IJA41_09930 [Clostridia bacterium]|nr:hypothetical protein [Clostridia bacterium]